MAFCMTKNEIVSHSATALEALKDRNDYNADFNRGLLAITTGAAINTSRCADTLAAIASKLDTIDSRVQVLTMENALNRNVMRDQLIVLSQIKALLAEGVADTAPTEGEIVSPFTVGLGEQSPAQRDVESLPEEVASKSWNPYRNKIVKAPPPLTPTVDDKEEVDLSAEDF